MSGSLYKSTNIKSLYYAALILVLIGAELNIAVPVIHENTINTDNIETQGFQEKRTKTIREGGWVIPIDKANQISVDNIIIDAIPVKEKIFSFKEKPIENIDIIFIDKDENVLIRSVPFELRELTAYEANGKVFGWKAKCVPVSYNKIVTEDSEVISTMSYVRTTVTFFYMDEDGDGNFETRYGTKQVPLIPNWVRSSLSKK